jgi:hypothetical protein
VNDEQSQLGKRGSVSDLLRDLSAKVVAGPLDLGLLLAIAIPNNREEVYAEAKRQKPER